MPPGGRVAMLTARRPRAVAPTCAPCASGRGTAPGAVRAPAPRSAAPRTDSGGPTWCGGQALVTCGRQQMPGARAESWLSLRMCAQQGGRRGLQLRLSPLHAPLVCGQSTVGAAAGALLRQPETLGSFRLRLAPRVRRGPARARRTHVWGLPRGFAARFGSALRAARRHMHARAMLPGGRVCHARGTSCPRLPSCLLCSARQGICVPARALACHLCAKWLPCSWPCGRGGLGWHSGEKGGEKLHQILAALPLICDFFRLFQLLSPALSLSLSLSLSRARPHTHDDAFSQGGDQER